MGSENSKSERYYAPPTDQDQYPVYRNDRFESQISSSQQRQQATAPPPSSSYHRHGQQQSQANIRATYTMEDQQRKPPSIPQRNAPPPDTRPPPPPTRQPHQPQQQVTVADVNKAFQELGTTTSTKSQIIEAPKPSPQQITKVLHLDIEKTSRPAAMKPSTVHENATNYRIEAPSSSLANPTTDHEIFRAKLKSSSPIEVRRYLVNNPYLSDVTFTLAGETIYAHKAMLITSSLLFREHLEVKKHQNLEIRDINRETFIDILTFCYTDKIQVTMENVMAILMAAQALDVRQLVNNCHGQVQAMMTYDNVFEILLKATDMKYEAIQKRCADFLTKNEEKCFNSGSFFSLSVDDMNKVLDFCKFMPDKMHEMTRRHFDGPSAPSTVPHASRRSASQPRVFHNSNMLPKKGAVKKNGGNNSNKARRDASLQASGNGKSSAAAPKATNQRAKQQNRNFSKSRENLCSPKLQLLNSDNNNCPKIPDLMSLPINQFERVLAQPNLVKQPQTHAKLNPVRPFATNSPLINYEESAAHRRSGNIITHDDEAESGGRVIIKIMDNNQGSNCLNTTFSRIDFICKRAMFINEIRFTEDLSAKGAQVIIRIATYDNRGTDVEIHKRIIDPKPGQRFSFMKFDRTPLMIYGGQKFYVKLSFSENVNLRHINKQGITANNFVDFALDNETKNYFNCIQSLVVSSVLNA